MPKAIENLRPSILTMKTMSLKPGINELTEKQVEENKDQLAVLEKCKMIKGVNLQKAEKPESGAAEGTILGNYKAGEAIELVEKTVDEKTLNDWRTLEKRATVLEAIEAQLTKLAETVKPKEKKGKK